MRIRSSRTWVAIAACLAAVLMRPIGAAAQTATVEGQVLDPFGAAVPGAAVALASGARTARLVSDHEGRFRFEGVSPGRYTLTIVREGFAALEQAIDVAEEPLVRSFRLEPATVVESVTVSGSARPYRAADAESTTRLGAPLLQQPQSVQVVTRAIIEERQLLRVNDVAYQASGVQPISGYGGVRSTSYFVRGFRQSSALGSFRNGFREDVTLASSDPANIERVEFLKGPASVLFGQAEVGGVVNTVTKRPPAAPYAAASLSFGSYGLARPTIDVGGPLGSDVRYRVNAAFEDQDSFRDSHHQRNVFVAPRVSWTPTPRTTVDIEAEGQRYDHTFDIGFLAQPEFLRVPLGAFYGEALNHARVRQGAGRVEIAHGIARDWSVRGAVALMDVGSTPNYVSMIGLQPDRHTINRILWRSAEDSRVSTVRGELRGTLQAGTRSHSIVVGVERTVRRNKYDFNGFSMAPIDLIEPIHGAVPGPRTSGFSDDQRWNATGVYAQGLVRLPARLAALVGARVDRSHAQFNDYHTGDRRGARDDNNVAPQAALLFSPTSSSSLYGSVSTSFVPQAPTVFSPASSAPDGFEPERGRQIEAGYKQDLLGGRLALTGAVFQIVKENVVTPDPVTPMVSVQTGEQRSRGVELDVTGELARGLQGVFTYAYIDAVVSRDNRIPVGHRLIGAPRHSGSVLMTYKVADGALSGAGFGVSLAAASRRYPTLPNNDAVLPAYGRVDLLLSYDRARWGLRTAVNNLLDGRHYDAHGFFIVPRAPLHVVSTLTVRLTK